MVLPGYVRAGDWRKPGLVEWVLARTDWVAVLSCIPLSAGLILYCVTVSAAHGDTKELLNIAQGGQSSLSWLATVYGVTLGITLPLTIIAILYSLLVVAASIYAHRHMYPEDPSPGWPPPVQPQQQPQQQQQQQQPQQGGTPPKAGETRWRSSKLPPAVPTLRRLPSNGSASGLVGIVAQPSARAAGLLKAQSLPGSIGGPAAPAPPTPPVLPNLALSLKEDKGQAAGMWERALGLAVAPPGMQSVLSMLGGADPRSARKGPHESAVVDITKLRSPMHRQLPSMLGSGGAGGNGGPDSARSGSVVLGRPPQPPALLPRQQRQASQQQEAAAKHPLSKGDSGTGATKRLLPSSSSSDHALSDMEKDATSSSTSPLPAALASPKPANGSSKRRRRAVGCWARRRTVRPPPLIGIGPGSEGGSGAADLEAAAEVEELRQPSLTPEEQRRLQQKPALRVYRALRGMLLTLIGANTATLVWLVILLVATGAWLVCSQAVHTSAQNTLKLYSTPLGAASDALGLTQQNQAAVSTFSQLFGMQFLSAVNKASSGKFNYTSYQQLEAVARERATKLGAAAVVAYNATVKDPEVEDLISPLFSGGSGLCPSTCLDFEYFDFLESDACVCEPDTINHVADLSGKTVDSLIISCVGLGLMILSVLVLLLRFAVIWGQVQTRWALRHAMQLYAAHHEEAAMRRRYGRSTSYVY